MLLNERLGSEQRAEYLKALEVAGPPSGLIWIATSGSTGRPKLVGLSRRGLLASADSVNRHLGAEPSDVWGLAIPPFHVGGLGIFARAFLLHQSVRDLRPWDSARLSHLDHITLLSLVPTQVRDLVEGGHRAPSCLRAVIVGGASLSPALYQRAVALGWPLLPSFGMTEAGSQIATAALSCRLSPDYPPLKVLPGWDLSVDDRGRLRLRGPALAVGSIEVTESPIWTPFASEAGWLSEDRAEFEDDFLVPLGRVGDYAKIGGELVSLSRVRARWESLGGKGVLLALPDSRLGECLHLVTEQESEDEIVARYEAQSLPFERIRRVHRRAIPRSELGKPLWAVLKAQILEEASLWD